MKKLIHRIVYNDYSFTILTKISAVFIGLVASAFSKRLLGPAIEGQLSYIDSALTLIVSFSSLGIYQCYTNERKTKSKAVLNKFLDIFAQQFLIYSLLGFVFLWLGHNPVLTIVCMMAPLQVWANQLSYVVIAEEVRYKNIIFLTARLTNTLFIMLAFFTLQPALWIGLAMVLVGNLITIIMSLWRFKYIGNPFKADWPYLMKLMPAALVWMLSALLMMLNYRVDELMLKWLGVPDIERGFYRTGVSLASYGWLIPDAFREVLVNRTARDDATKDMVFSMKNSFYLMLIVFVLIVIFGKTAIRLLFGARYLPSYRVTVILLGGILTMQYFKLIGALLQSQKKRGLYLGVLAVSAVCNILANLYAIPRFGIEGAAFSSVFSYSIAGLALLVYFMRQYKIPFRELFFFQKGEIQSYYRRFFHKQN